MRNATQGYHTRDTSSDFASIDGHLGRMKGLILSINVKLSQSVLLPVLLSFLAVSGYCGSSNETVQ
ncbi:MAG TPA: hypothetical protein VGL94_12045 [Ktedonobacteraceae bacterium]